MFFVFFKQWWRNVQMEKTDASVCVCVYLSIPPCVCNASLSTQPPRQTTASNHSTNQPPNHTPHTHTEP